MLFLQGFPGTEGDDLVCERLAMAGVNVFSYNYRGTFGSEGEWSFGSAVADIGAAWEFLQDVGAIQGYLIDKESLVLGGWSFGAGITPAGAARNPTVKRFFMISGRNFGEEARHIATNPEYAAQVRANLEGLRAPDGPLRFRDDFHEDLTAIQEELDHLNLAPQLGDRHILLIAGWEDDLSPLEKYTLPFYRALRTHGAKNARIEAVQDGHDFADSQAQLVRIIVDWLGSKSKEMRT